MWKPQCVGWPWSEVKFESADFRSDRGASITRQIPHGQWEQSFFLIDHVLLRHLMNQSEVRDLILAFPNWYLTAWFLSDKPNSRQYSGKRYIKGLQFPDQLVSTNCFSSYPTTTTNLQIAFKLIMNTVSVLLLSFCHRSIHWPTQCFALHSQY